MARFRVLYAFVDGAVVFYVGQCRHFYRRLGVHRFDAKTKQQRVYRYIRGAQSEGRTIEVQVLAILPDDSVFARLVEQLVIADIGLVEDGGSLLNGRRSSIGPAGYIEEAIAKMSEGSKRISYDVRSESQRKTNTDPARRALLSKKLKAAWSDPNYRERAGAIQRSPEVQAKRSAEMKRRWADPEFRKKMAKRAPRTWTEEARATHGDKCRATLAAKVD